MAILSKNIIKKLYYKEGLSTIEIGKELAVSEWVVLSFMRRNDMARRTFFEANQKKFERKPLSFSIKKNLSVKEKELKTAGAMIYWAEGAKAVNSAWTIDFANSNTSMVKLFLKFLREICRVDEKRLIVQLYCYSNQGVEDLKKYWYKETRIPLTQFIKPYVREDFLPEKIGKMKYGLVHIRYSDKKLLLQIGRWIEEYCLK